MKRDLIQNINIHQVKVSENYYFYALFFFLRFKYEYTKVTASSDKPYAWSVATSKF